MEKWWICFIIVCILFIILKTWCRECHNKNFRETMGNNLTITNEKPHNWGVIAMKGFVLSLIISGARHNTDEAIINGTYGALASVLMVGIFE